MVDAHVDEQVTLLAAGVHAPALQPPAVQLALLVGQTLCGSLPVGTLAHVPGDDARLHALQPLHMLCGTLQQVPSTQLPDMHSPSPPHGEPFVFGPHWLALHGVPPLHCEGLLHDE